MMMGAGLLVMLVVALIVIGVPVLIAALIAGGGLAALFKSRPREEVDRSPSFQKPTVDRKCPTCGRAVRPDWNVCPSCGAALT